MRRHIIAVSERICRMKKKTQIRVDMYDIGDGLTLMNVINKNETGKMHQITT